MKYFPLWNGGRSYPPSLMVLVITATTEDLVDIYSESTIKKGFSYWENKKNSFFYINKEISGTVNGILKKAEKNEKYLYDIFIIAYKKSLKMRLFSEQFRKANFKNKNLTDLIKLYEKFNKIFIDFYKYGGLLPIIGYKEDNFLYKNAYKTLRNKIRNNPEKFAEYLIILTSPQKRLKTKELELEVLKLAKKTNSLSLKTKKEIKEKLKDEIKALKEKYEWMAYDFTNNITWNFDYFLNMIYEKLSLDINKNIVEIKNYEESTKKDFKVLVKRLKLKGSEIKIFKLVGALGYYKWAREYEFQEAVYNLKYLQDEIGKRVGLTTLEAKYILVDEFGEYSKKDLKNLAKGRMDCSLAIYERKKGLKFYQGKVAREMYKKIDFVKPKEDIKKENIKGIPARAGKIKGVVRVINNSRDMSKMKQGNILVSLATTPAIISAMKKAAAIITDEGGITCHAAIVSRELGIPCVVGTKIATQVLKDEDVVEVDANRGIIKKIK